MSYRWEPPPRHGNGWGGGPEEPLVGMEDTPFICKILISKLEMYGLIFSWFYPVFFLIFLHRNAMYINSHFLVLCLMFSSVLP